MFQHLKSACHIKTFELLQHEVSNVSAAYVSAMGDSFRNCVSIEFEARIVDIFQMHREVTDTCTYFKHAYARRDIGCSNPEFRLIRAVIAWTAGHCRIERSIAGNQRAKE